ncbi:hypothetical protein Hanom_Chr06g00487011 [Helianthus anomalus]
MNKFNHTTYTTNGLTSYNSRSMIPRLLPSPSRKTTNVGNHHQPPQRGSRQVTAVEMKKKSENRKY